jgi:hypothetical protein
MATEETIEFVSGISLGQANEYTALAMLERRAPKPDREHHRPLSSFSARHLERFPIGTSYPAIFERVSSLFQAKPLPGNTLAVDQTALADPVLRMFGAPRPLVEFGRPLSRTVCPLRRTRASGRCRKRIRSERCRFFSRSSGSKSLPSCPRRPRWSTS